MRYENSIFFAKVASPSPISQIPSRIAILRSGYKYADNRTGSPYIELSMVHMLQVTELKRQSVSIDCSFFGLVTLNRIVKGVQNCPPSVGIVTAQASELVETALLVSPCFNISAF